MSLLIVNLLPEDDPAALAAIETLGAAVPTTASSTLTRKTSGPAWAATPAGW